MEEYRQVVLLRCCINSKRPRLQRVIDLIVGAKFDPLHAEISATTLKFLHQIGLKRVKRHKADQLVRKGAHKGCCRIIVIASPIVDIPTVVPAVWPRQTVIGIAWMPGDVKDDR